MQEVTATEARAHWARVLRKVGRGESVAITRHGKTVAHMIPCWCKRAVDRFRRRSRKWELAGMSTWEILRVRHSGHRF